MNNDGIVIEFNPTGGNGTGAVTARLGDEVLAIDTFNIARATARSKFAAQVADGRPGIDIEDVKRSLLKVANGVGQRPEPKSEPLASAPELDVTRIVRPELFHTTDVSGALIPTASILGGEPVGRWRLYLRWHVDGKRECRDLSESIDLPDGGPLWLHPIPAKPIVAMRPGWTAKARGAWLDGADAPNAVEIFKRICQRLAYFLDFTGKTARGDLAALAIWLMFSYVYPCWTAVPYLCIGGPLGSGKSRVFELLSRMLFRPLQSSNMTAACLFRTLHESGGVLLLDEAERLRDSTPGAGEILSILLSGYKVGSPARRLEQAGDGQFRTLSFDVFGPKAIAGIARLPDPLVSRCIKITMFRAARGSVKPRRRIDEDAGTWAGIRDDLHAWALEHGLTWLQLARRADVCPAMTGRDYEIWQPLLALAALIQDAGAEGLLDTMQGHAGAVIDSSEEDSTPDTDELLLRLLADSVAAGAQGRVTPGDLLRLARERESGPFERWSPRGVAATLKRYKVRTTKVHGRKVYRDVTLEQLEQISAAYGLDLSVGTCPCPPCTPVRLKQTRIEAARRRMYPAMCPAKPPILNGKSWLGVHGAHRVHC